MFQILQRLHAFHAISRPQSKIQYCRSNNPPQLSFFIYMQPCSMNKGYKKILEKTPSLLPSTEIFSKRRKIYSWLKGSQSMTLLLLPTAFKHNLRTVAELSNFFPACRQTSNETTQTNASKDNPCPNQKAPLLF